MIPFRLGDIILTTPISGGGPAVRWDAAVRIGREGMHGFAGDAGRCRKMREKRGDTSKY